MPKKNKKEGGGGGGGGGGAAGIRGGQGSAVSEAAAAEIVTAGATIKAGMESNSSPTVPRRPLHVEGWLLRQSTQHELSGFVKLWFVLSGHVLEYKFSKVLFVFASLK